MERSELTTLKDLRTIRGATQAQLAARLGIHQTAVSRLEGHSGVSVTMLKSFIEALGGKLHLTATFPDTAVNLSKIAETPVFAQLQALVLKQCQVHPMPPNRGDGLFMIRRVDESLVELEKSPNRQIVKIPLRRVLEIVPGSLSAAPTIVLRGGPQWSAHEKLRQVVLD